MAEARCSPNHIYDEIIQGTYKPNKAPKGEMESMLNITVIVV